MQVVSSGDRAVTHGSQICQLIRITNEFLFLKAIPMPSLKSTDSGCFA